MDRRTGDKMDKIAKVRAWLDNKTLLNNTVNFLFSRQVSGLSKNTIYPSTAKGLLAQLFSNSGLGFRNTDLLDGYTDRGPRLTEQDFQILTQKYVSIYRLKNTLIHLICRCNSSWKQTRLLVFSVKIHFRIHRAYRIGTSF